MPGFEKQGITNDKIAALTAIENSQETVRALAEAWGWTAGSSGQIMSSNNTLAAALLTWTLTAIGLLCTTMPP